MSPITGSTPTAWSDLADTTRSGLGIARTIACGFVSLPLRSWTWKVPPGTSTLGDLGQVREDRGPIGDVLEHLEGKDVVDRLVLDPGEGAAVADVPGGLSDQGSCDDAMW